jgi:Protein of unknown function (DUF2946)
VARRLTRPLLILILAAQYGAVALLGIGLHLLPGCAHRAAARSADADRGDGVHPARPDSSSDHQCAICDHLAQGQLVASPPVVPSSTADAPRLPATRPAIFPRVVWLVSRPRAPPHPA